MLGQDPPQAYVEEDLLRTNVCLLPVVCRNWRRANRIEHYVPGEKKEGYDEGELVPKLQYTDN